MANDNSMLTDRVVVIDQESYSLAVIPASNSKIVVEERNRMLGHLNILQLVQDLGRLGKFIKVAYNGVAGNTNLQIQVQTIGYEVVALGDTSASTIDKFENASKLVVEDLQCCYEYLLDGLEGLALETYTTISAVAKKMELEAEKLSNDFKRAEENTKKTLVNTQLAQGKETEAQKKLKKDMEEYERTKEKANIEKQEAAAALDKADQMYKEVRLREDKILADEASITREMIRVLGTVANTATNIVSFKGLGKLCGAAATMVTGAAGGVAAANEKNKEKKKKKSKEDNENSSDDEDQKIKATPRSAAQEALKSAGEEKLRYLAEMDKYRNSQTEALCKMAEMTSLLKNSADQSNISDATITALHNAIGTLKNLVEVMIQATQFWKKLSEHCKELAEGTLRAKIEKVLDKPDEVKKKVWTNPAFKREAIRQYAGWVALRDVCTEYKGSALKTTKELHAYMRENPTTEQSRKNIVQLAVELEAEFELEKRKNAQDNEASRKEQLALKAELQTAAEAELLATAETELQITDETELQTTAEAEL